MVSENENTCCCCCKSQDKENSFHDEGTVDEHVHYNKALQID